MDLSTFISDPRRRDELAAALVQALGGKTKKSPAYLYQIATGRRAASPKFAQEIERQTGGVVTKESLRPDVWASKENK